MKILIAGGSGATGKHLAAQLLARGHSIHVVVRPASQIPDSWIANDKVTITKAFINALSVEEMALLLADCQAVASCLGHNLTLKGIYGKPRKLVREAVSLICKAIAANAPETPVKLVLMNTSGYSNRDINEPISPGEKIIAGLIRLLLPPFPDNEQAADYLRVTIGQYNPVLQWVVVRPDSLINEEQVTDYTLHPSPVRSALLNPGKTSRINVADFMTRLIDNDELWKTWKGQMPLIYNRE